MISEVTRLRLTRTLVRKGVPARTSYLTPFSGFQEPCSLRT